MTFGKTIARNAGAIIILLLSVCGCQIRNQAYRRQMPVVSVPPPPPLPVDKETAQKEENVPCDEKNLLARPCLAFLEFDDFGEVWERTAESDKWGGGRPAQLSRILALIDKAKEQDPYGKPLIVTFIHGWKHNASGEKPAKEDLNITGLKSVLTDLHDNMWKGHVVIGIYIAWRGGLIKPYWPVSQQFSYWNREAAAIRVGNTSITDALIEISDRTRAKFNCDAHACSQHCPLENNEEGWCSPVLLFVGHSFGALVLERGLSQATVTRMEREWNKAAETSKQTIEPLADLIIFINSAAAAIESKQLLDYLAFSHFIYRPAGKDEPLILSVTSEADMATGIVLKIGHGPPLLGYKVHGSMRSKPSASNPPSGCLTRSQTESGTCGTTEYAHVCFEPPKSNERAALDLAKSSVRTDLSQSDYYLSTTAHMQALWSHTVVKSPTKPAECPAGPDSSPYVQVSTAGAEYSVIPMCGRCNGTPYWAIQVPKEIIPDHGTIFTETLLTFLRPFIPTPQRKPMLQKTNAPKN